MGYPTLDIAARKALSEVEQVDFRISLSEDSRVILQTTLSYDLHVRPSTFIYTRLREKSLLEQLRIRRVDDEEWAELEPLSLLSLALHSGEKIEIEVQEPLSKSRILDVMNIFRSCPRYRNYSSEVPKTPKTPVKFELLSSEESSVKRAAKASLDHPYAEGETQKFEEEFLANNSDTLLVRLNLENFIIGHLAEIEAYILERMGGVLPDCDELDRCFKRLIAEDLGGKMNMVSFDIPFDNLLQTRDVCYHLHNKQKLGNKKLPYALIHIEWAQDYGESWRRNQTLRHRYFYEKESEYYRNLFLLLVRRQKHHLESFVDKWGERLQFSLQNRKNLSKLLLVIENEMDTFSPNFKNPEGFRKHIRMMSRSIIADVSRLTPYLQFVEDQSIYLNTET